MTGTLFPNLPRDEAEALRRLAGLDVAPDLVGFWPDASLLVYDFVEGDMWDGDMASVARLLLRKEAADPTGFRTVPLTIPDIIAEGDALFAAAAHASCPHRRQRRGAATSKALPDPHGYRREPCGAGSGSASH